MVLKIQRVLKILAIIWSSQLCAENTSTEIITVTGSHLANKSVIERLNKVVISESEISALAANSFADILRGVPGIDIMEQGGLGGLTFLSIRGGDPNFVTILIDGVKVNDPTNSRGGAFDLGTLDPNLIAQVEIFYSSLSTVFGSDALAGVISITTKGVIENKIASVSLKAGSNDSVGGSLHLALPIEDIAQLSLSGSVQNGDNSSFGDKFKRQEVIASLRSTSKSNTLWNLGVFFADGKSSAFPEDSGGDRLSIIRSPEVRDYTQTNLSANLQHQLNDALTFDLKSAWSERNEDILNPGIAQGILDAVPAIDSFANYQRLDISTIINYSISTDVKIALGLALTEEDGGMDSLIDFGFPVPADYSFKRKINAIFSELSYEATNKLNFIMAIRHDNTDDISVNTYRFISRYQLNLATDVSIQYSEGFKLPSFFAVGHPFVGNPLLRPERSKNYDLTINHRLLNEKLIARMSVYRNVYTDLVDFDPIEFINVNREKVETKGTEVSLSYKVNEELNISGQVSYNKINTANSEIKLRRRPELKGSLAVNYQPNEFYSLNARITMNDTYYDSSIPTGLVEMNSYSRIDVSGAWFVTKDITLRLNVNNLLDDSYEEAIGFRNMGQNITMSVTKSY
tara:strand:+ start:2256 stop:4142 length:1887 start_codon:yes stop_codon:yes gene_type:complete